MRSDLTARLAALPGADDLAALAARVDRADPAGVRGAGAAFDRAAEGMRGTREDVRRAVSGVGDAWRGAGAEAFTGWAEDFGRAGGRTEQAVRGVGAEVEGIATTLQGLRDEIRGHVSRALDAAAAARTVAATRLPTDGGAVVGPDEVVRGAVAGPTADARAAVGRAEAELASAAARLRAHLGGLRGYSRLAVPDASRPVPAGSDGSVVGEAAPVTPTDGDPDAPDGSTAPSDQGSPDQGSDTTPAPDTAAEPDTTPAPTDAAPAAKPLTGGPPGKVGDWIREATGILAANGVPADKMDPDDIATIIARESGGNPDAVNDWDSNAAKGTPSQGLMQTIGPTFDAHKLPGHGEIRDPIDNIIAGVRYAIDRYGSVSSVPGIKALGHGGGYVGY